MIPNVTHGGSAPRLARYLFGPGHANEHDDQHVVAASYVMSLAKGCAPGLYLNANEGAALGRVLEQPVKDYGVSITQPKYAKDANGNVLLDDEGKKVVEKRLDAHVWHCSLSLRPDEAPLDDATWQAIATDFMTDMGFASDDVSKECRWFAVRHGFTKQGGDHIHIVASRVREDGTRWRLPNRQDNDFRVAQKVCRTLESRYNLTPLDAGPRKGKVHHDTMGELQQAEDDFKATYGISFPYEKYRGTGAPVRPPTRSGRLEVAMRAARAAASTEEEYVQELRSKGVLVRPREETVAGKTRVNGYSVAWPARDGEKQIWWAPSKIASDLSLPRLRRQAFDASSLSDDELLDVWRGGDVESATEDAVAALKEQHSTFDSAQYDAVWDEVCDLLSATVEQLNESSSWDEFADVCRDAAGYFSVLSDHVDRDGWRIAQTARTLGRAAQYKEPSRSRDAYTVTIPRWPAMRSLSHARPGAGIPKRAVTSFDILGAALSNGFMLRGDTAAAKRYRAEVDAAVEVLRQHELEETQTAHEISRKRELAEAVRRGDVVMGEDGQWRPYSELLDGPRTPQQPEPVAPEQPIEAVSARTTDPAQRPSGPEPRPQQDETERRVRRP